MNTSQNPLNSIPPVVRNLLIINVIMLLATYTFNNIDLVDLDKYLAIYNFSSPHFKPYQLVTHLFMHGSFFHLFFNMFALWMFGKILEMVWGGKRFFIFYIVTGLGAAFIHLIIQYIELNSLQNAMDVFVNSPTPAAFREFLKEKTPFISTLSPIEEFITADDRIAFLSKANSELFRFISEWEVNIDKKEYATEAINYVMSFGNAKMNIPTVGASGAVFGILLAFGMLFPNTQLMLLIPPVPIKAKYMVIVYGVAELFFGVANFSGDNIAHFAHLGGMIFGFIMIKIWNSDKKILF